MKYWAITNCRVSSDEQLKNNSLNRQKASVLEAAKRLGVTIPKDGQWSGSVSSKRGRNYNRKDVREMLDYCKKHKQVKYLIIDEPDRFMRSVDEAFYWETEFREKVGVQIYYASDDALNGNDLLAKMTRFMKYFTAEGSNEERQRKSISGDTKAIAEGRYPFHPKLGYMKGSTPGIHVIAPEIGALMKDILKKLSAGILSLADSLAEYNGSSYIQSGKHCGYKMDKWRKIVTDPYYAGIVEMNRQVKARNEHGLHEPLISIQEHLRIIEIVVKRRKNQSGPRKNGNPIFPLNTITVCEQCTKNEEELGRTGRNNRGKFVGFEHGNGHTDKRYRRYRCRKCGRSILRDELHENVKELLSHIDFTDIGRQYLEDALNRVWKIEEDNMTENITKLKNEVTKNRRINNELIDKLAVTSNETVYRRIEERIEEKTKEIERIEEKIQDIENRQDSNKRQFIDFALNFADNLGAHFFEIDPSLIKEFKLLLFPDGFYVNSKNKVYTTIISPFYRLRAIKKTSEDAYLNLMVRVKRL